MTTHRFAGVLRSPPLPNARKRGFDAGGRRVERSGLRSSSPHSTGSGAATATYGGSAPVADAPQPITVVRMRPAPAIRCRSVQPDVLRATLVTPCAPRRRRSRTARRTPPVRQRPARRLKPLRFTLLQRQPDGRRTEILRPCAGILRVGRCPDGCWRESREGICEWRWLVNRVAAARPPMLTRPAVSARSRGSSCPGMSRCGKP